MRRGKLSAERMDVARRLTILSVGDCDLMEESVALSCSMEEIEAGDDAVFTMTG